MRVIFMGTPDFAVGTLEALIEAGHDVDLVVTQPDRAKGRGKSVAFSPVKETALAHGIRVYQPERLRNPECIEYLRVIQADIIVVAAYGQILPKEILTMPPFGCINVHASLLPKYRGAAPIQWAVINGEKTTGVTIMRMDEGLDTGDMIRQEEIELKPDETGGSLFERLSKVGAEACVRALADIGDGTASYTAQKHYLATKVGMIKKEHGRMDFKKSAVQLERLIRGLNPWPGTFTELNGRTIKIWKARVEAYDSYPAAPGTIIEVTRDAIHVATGDGVLVITEVQLQGKKRMACADFLRGYHINVGDILG
ncbi:MAG: methionyl-tRNA formyltransferase [Clostridiales bacterium]|nr:methionyl-tRNA formyltransferase [Clostridiales bacterium]